MDRFTVAWLLMGAYFVVVEGIALFNHRANDTLSEKVWKWSGIGDATQPRPVVTGSIRLRRFALLAFMAWLTMHFLTGGRF